MYHIRHCAEGWLACYKIDAIELADATDELDSRCNGLQDKRGRSSSFV